MSDLGLNWYFYGLRNNFDPLLGRFHSIDPLATQFPQWSSYQFAGLNPAKFVDLDGAEPAYYDIQSGQIVPASDQIRHTPPASAQFLSNGGQPDPTYEVMLGFTPAGVALDVLDLATAIQDGDGVGIALGAAGFLPGGDLLKAARKLDNVADNISDVARKSDFVVTPDGTAVSTDLNKVQESFDDAGFRQIESNPTNTIYEVPRADGSGTFYSRLQQGNNPRRSNVDGDRVVNTRNTGNTRNREYVNPNGSDIRGPVPLDKRREIGHVQLEPRP